MRTIEHVSLTLQPPQHGWLPVRLELDSFVLDTAASNVLNDPLGELIDAVGFCKPPLVGRHRVCLWLEPEGYAIDISPGVSPGRCIIRVSYDDSFVPPMLRRDMTVAFEGEADLVAARTALWSALSQWSEQVEPALVDAWGRGQDYAKRLAGLRLGPSR